MNDEGDSAGDSIASDVVDAYVDFAEQAAPDQPLDIEACCRNHPEIAPQLRALHVRFRRIMGLFSAPDGHAAGATRPAPAPGSNPPRVPRGPPAERLLVHEELGRGGMGIVQRVWDTELDRALAMKVIRPGRSPDSDHSRRLARFLSEARITSQLDHPGIVPVHELGRDERGEPYFTMKLVKGVDLGVLIARAHAGDPEWTLPRMLGVLVRVCEAMAYAHDKRVIHRDLKPANIMVGQFGEAYVMDWGLARALDQPDRVDLRLHPDNEARDAAWLPVDGRDQRLLTEEGDVVGTASYMSPEQARGRIAEMGPATDIYSLGAILYHLLTGHAPYSGQGERLDAWAVLQRVIAGPPAPVHALKAGVAPELQSICERALQRAVHDRYATVADMARDLRAYLEGRVVAAHETGAWAEFRKWVERNRAFAASVGAGILLAFAAVAGLSLQARQHNAELSRKNETIREEKDNVENLSDRRVLGTLTAEAELLWPISSFLVGPCEAWLDRAAVLVARLPTHEQHLVAVRSGTGASAGALPVDDSRTRAFSAELADVRRRLERMALERDHANEPDRPRLDAKLDALHARAEELESRLHDSLVPDLGDERRTWQGEQLWILVDELRDFAGPGGLVESVERRLADARVIKQQSLEAAARIWTDACRSIADRDECSAYQGLLIEPQEGLVPLGRSPSTGLWEFLVHGTGSALERDPGSGELVVTGESGIVLVLLPGGAFRMGAVPQGDTNVDPAASALWSPVHEVRLAPFLLGKCELTQGQWRRLGGVDASAIAEESLGDDASRHPVERVSWLECVDVLRRRRLELPTEAQWEYAARAGTTTRWWFGDDESGLVRAGNVVDEAARVALGDPTWQYHSWNDGYAEHAPVDAFTPNPFGLYGVVGNVFEWCLDGADEESPGRGLRAYELPEEPGTGLRRLAATEKRVVRGGAWQLVAAYSSSAARSFRFPDFKAVNVGVRAARALVVH